ncbi:MAG: carboxypeptidase-like regulatory domain-containing protein, partial [Armatimonadota bacterium]|nr:carboxypeptidase-like regulatory domain-containing protein [Armatimonadota bacterium]
MFRSLGSRLGLLTALCAMLIACLSVAKAETTYGYSIKGRVTTSAGAAIAGVGILLNDGTTAVATTGSEGYFQISGLAAGNYVVKARKEGFTFTPVSKTITLPTSGEPYSPSGVALFTGAPVVSTYIIRGRVALSNGAAIAGVSILLNDSTTVVATTNNEGYFEISGLAAGSYVVKPHKEGFTFSPTSRTVTLPTSGASYSPSGVALFTGAPVVTTYSIRGRAATSARVAITGVSILLNDGTTAAATTNSEGFFQISGLAAGSHVVKVRKEGFTFTPVSKTVTLPTSGQPYSPNGVAFFVGAPVIPTYSIRGRVALSNG